MTSRRTGTLLPAACVSALLLSSCGWLDDDAPQGEDQPTDETEAEGQDESPDPDGDEDDDEDDPDGDASGEEQPGAGEIDQAQDGSRAVPPEEAIASIEYELGGDDSVIASVATLEETDDFLLMEVYYWPQLEDEGASLSIHDMLGEQASNTPGPLPRIYDRDNLKVYRAFHHNDTTGAFGSPSASDGGAIYWWGFFPLFEDEVDAVDIRFAQERPHLQDVPFRSSGAGSDDS